MATDIVIVAGRNPLDETSGGHSSYVRSHARAAILAGYRPHLFCVGSKAAEIETDYGAVHVVASPYRPFRQMMAALHARPLAAAIARFAPPLIHSFGVWGIAAVRAAALMQTKPMLIQSSYTTYRDEAWSHVRGAGPYDLATRLRFLGLYAWVVLAVESWERRAYRAAHVVLVNYESVARLIHQRHGVRCRIVPYAAETAFKPASFDTDVARDPALILSIARHEPRKGNDVLLHALAKLQAEGIDFHARLIGGGPLLEKHRRLASRLGLDARIDVLGIVDDIRPHLRDPGIFALPSRKEQSGSLALLEAMQGGLAIVASAVDGLLEDLSDGANALLPPPGDAGALAAALRRVLTNAPLRQGLSARARETFEARFSAARFAEELGRVYRELGV